MIENQKRYEALSSRLKNKVSKSTINNYRTAMKRYIEIVQKDLTKH
jgi:hypothetical protein